MTKIPEIRAGIETGPVAAAVQDLKNAYQTLHTDFSGIHLYLKAINRLLHEPASTACSVIEHAITELDAHRDNGLPAFHKMSAKKLLRLALVFAFNDSTARAQLGCLSRYSGDISPPVLILAGGAADMPGDTQSRYNQTVLQILKPFKGTVISGGTVSGLPGMAGKVVEQIRRSGQQNFSLIGYLPETLTAHITPDNRYDCLVRTENDHFSVLEPLQYWIDLAVHNIKIQDICLWGIDGGPIAAFEYRLALALGARTVVLRSSGRAADELIEDEYWRKNSNLVAWDDSNDFLEMQQV